MPDPFALMPTYPFASADPFGLTATYPFASADPFGLTATYPFGSAGGSGEANAPVFINPDPSGEANGSVGACPDPRFMATGLGLRHFDPSAAASTYVDAGRESVGRAKQQVVASPGSIAAHSERTKRDDLGFVEHFQADLFAEPAVGTLDNADFSEPILYAVIGPERRIGQVEVLAETIKVHLHDKRVCHDTPIGSDDVVVRE